VLRLIPGHEAPAAGLGCPNDGIGLQAGLVIGFGEHFTVMRAHGLQGRCLTRNQNNAIRILIVPIVLQFTYDTSGYRVLLGRRQGSEVSSCA
jgi:hypothetical protein